MFVKLSLDWMYITTCFQNNLIMFSQGQLFKDSRGVKLTMQIIMIPLHVTPFIKYNIVSINVHVLSYKDMFPELQHSSKK